MFTFQTMQEVGDIQLLNYNDLEYVQSPPVSVVVTREFRTYMARELEKTVKYNNKPGAPTPLIYPLISDNGAPISKSNNRTIMVDLNSGNRFVSANTSYVCFDFNLVSPVLSGIPGEDLLIDFNDRGSWFTRVGNMAARQGNLFTNLFNTAKWIHSGKREIEYVQHVSHSAYLHCMKQASDWNRSVGSLFTLEKPIGPLTAVDPVYYPARGINKVLTTVSVMIPLGVLFPSWRIKDSNLIPPSLIAGSKMEFELTPIQNAFLMYWDDGLLLREDSSSIDFVQYEYSVRNLRVVLDERELSSSVNSLMWNVSTTVGTPLQMLTSDVSMYQRQLNPDDVPLHEVHVPVDTYVSLKRNLSRLNELLVTPMVQPGGYVMDAFIPLVRSPILYTGDVLTMKEYRYSTPSSYWPQKEPTWLVDLTPVSFMQWMWNNCCTGLTVDEWKYYVNGFYMNFLRQTANQESGTSITQLRPMGLMHSFDWVSIFGDSSVELIREVYGNYQLRWYMEYQRFINVSGNVLETLE